MQRPLFSSSLAEKRRTRVSALPIEEAGDAYGLASGIQSLFYDFGYCALTEMRLASGQRQTLWAQIGAGDLPSQKSK